MRPVFIADVHYNSTGKCLEQSLPHIGFHIAIEKKYIYAMNANICTLLIFLLLGTAPIALPSCQPGPGGNEEKTVEEIMTQSTISNADIIRNPISAQGPRDTINVAEFTFETDMLNFGTANEGDVVVESFTFTNTGKVPLIINDARSTCGCTVPEWPKEPIPPGESGEIEVHFNTSNKPGEQVKPITITANTYPAEKRVYLQGKVIPKEEGS